MLDLTTFLYSRLFKFLAENRDSALLSITPHLGYPIPPKELSPTVLGFYGANWKDINHVRNIVDCYIRQCHYKTKILNLRASLIRCISLGLLLKYKTISLYGVDPENPRYYFDSVPDRLIFPEIASQYKFLFSQLSGNFSKMNSASSHPSESNTNIPPLSRCLMYFLFAMRTVPEFNTSIKYFGHSRTWINLSYLMPDILSIHNNN